MRRGEEEEKEGDTDDTTGVVWALWGQREEK